MCMDRVLNSTWGKAVMVVCAFRLAERRKNSSAKSHPKVHHGLWKARITTYIAHGETNSCKPAGTGVSYV
jgi:hypothetical protein